MINSIFDPGNVDSVFKAQITFNFIFFSTESILKNLYNTPGFNFNSLENSLLDLLKESHNHKIQLNIPAKIFDVVNELNKKGIKVNLFNSGFVKGLENDWGYLELLIDYNKLNPSKYYDLQGLDFISEKIIENYENMTDQEIAKASEIMTKLIRYLGSYNSNAIQDIDNYNNIKALCGNLNNVQPKTIEGFYSDKFANLNSFTQKIQENYNSSVPGFLRVDNEHRSSVKRKISEVQIKENSSVKKPRTR